MVLAGFVAGFGWFWVVLGGFGWFRVLVTTGYCCEDLESVYAHRFTSKTG